MIFWLPLWYLEVPLARFSLHWYSAGGGKIDILLRWTSKEMEQKDMIPLIDQTDMPRPTEQNAMRTLINTIEGGF